MGYVDNNLLNGETVVYRAKLHWTIFLKPLIVLVLAFLLIGARIWSTPLVQRFVPAGTSPTDVAQLQNYAVLLGFIVLIPDVVYALSRVILYLSSEFAVTDKRVIIKVGWIRRASFELMLSKIEGIGVEQSILGRILGYGTISVRGTGGTKNPYPNIARPLEFRRQVQQQESLSQRASA
jgi:uncharacterized membrane protein YdbT with pleckstrin-like domain